MSPEIHAHFQTIGLEQAGVVGVSWVKLALSSALGLLFASVVMRALRRSSFWYRFVLSLTTALGGIALVSGTYDSNAKLAEWRMPVAMEVKRIRLDNFKEQLAREIDYLCTTKFVKGKNSPPSFDSMVVDQRESCARVKAISNDISSPSFDGKLKLSGLRDPSFRNLVSRHSAKSLLSLAEPYLMALADVEQLRSFKDPNEIQLTLAVLGPYAVVLAICIGLASIWYPLSHSSSDNKGLER